MDTAVHETAIAEVSFADVVFACEPIAALWDELDGMVALNNEETGGLGLPLNLDKAKYETLESLGMLEVHTARSVRGQSDGVLVGYSCVLIAPSMRHAGVVMAVQDALWLHPSWRHGTTGVRLIKWSDRRLSERGDVYAVMRQSTTQKPIKPVLARLGYVTAEETMILRLQEGE